MKHLADANGVVHLRQFQGIALPPVDIDNYPGVVGFCAVVDTETTGVAHYSDKIIEIAVLVAAFDVASGKLLEVLDRYESLNDPGMPIPAAATAVNGITDEQVRGQHIDWAHVSEMLSSVDFCVAHNAEFDTRFVKLAIGQHVPTAPESIWVCSLNQLKWPGLPNRQLGTLGLWDGFWYEAHRAMMDVEALAQVLHDSERFGDLARIATEPSYEVQVSGGPRDDESLNKLKTAERRFTWDKTRTMWWRVVSTKEEAIDVVRYLDNYYPGRNESRVVGIKPQRRYSPGFAVYINNGADFRREWGI